jgi:thioredoxin-like negative regulator of GroEL
LGPKLERLAREKRNFRLLVIDIDKWNSPVARQHDINRLPTLWLCKDGEVVSTDSREVLAFLQK